MRKYHPQLELQARKSNLILKLARIHLRSMKSWRKVELYQYIINNLS